MREADITSRQNPRVKAVCALADKKGREASGRFRIDGIKLFSEACRSDMEIAEVYVRLSSMEAVTARVGQELARFEHRMITVSDEVFAKMSEEKAPEGILAVAEQPKQLHRVGDGAVALLPHERVCFLEAIRDPGNLGTILRIADWFGADAVFATRDTVDVFNPKVVQATMGAIFRVKMHYVDLPQLSRLVLDKGGSIFGTFLDGENMYRKDLDNGLESPAMIVIGNESNGISEGMASLVTDRLYIPPYPADQPGSESLNAAIATAITVAEFRRRLY